MLPKPCRFNNKYYKYRTKADFTRLDHHFDYSSLPNISTTIIYQLGKLPTNYKIYLDDDNYNAIATWYWLQELTILDVVISYSKFINKHSQHPASAILLHLYPEYKQELIKLFLRIGKRKLQGQSSW